jgi:mannosylglucosylglycerate synthase
MKIAILHYSVPPVVGGVESVIQAHTRLLLEAGFAVTLVAGAGDKSALTERTQLIRIPEMDSRHPQIMQASRELEAGRVPGDFDALVEGLENSLEDALQGMDQVIVHNVFTKHFNLPLTAALMGLLDNAKIKRCITWCHDFTWTSPHSRPLVHPGYPWDLLRTYRDELTYVTVSRSRQAELVDLFKLAGEKIKVIYNGVDPAELFSLSGEGIALIDRLDLNAADLVLLMPVRITQAKNIELALQVVASLKNKGLRPKLVITGPPDPHDSGDLTYYQSLLDLRRKLGVVQEARFVYESGLGWPAGYTIELPVVREIYRVCDALFMPSHREGFGMPILEAGLMGMPIFSASIPAADEIGGAQVIHLSHTDDAEKIAGLILSWCQSSPTQQLRQRIRQNFTWQAIFKHDILPLLMGSEAA